MDCNLHDPDVTWSCICRWDEAGNHDVACGSGVCDTPHWRKNVHCRMLSVQVPTGKTLGPNNIEPPGLYPPRDRFQIGSMAGPTILCVGCGFRNVRFFFLFRGPFSQQW